MTCSDVMTSSLRCCYPNDTVIRAAEIMRDEDVGPVPVVEPTSGRLVGLVTDRDITIHVVARAADCGSVEVQEVMSRDLITCAVDDEYHTALEKMSRNQVRRIPVIHSDGTLAGIISQADVARYSNEQETGSVVEDISDAARAPAIFPESSSSVPSILLGAAAFTLGAACMYMLDPDRGRSRRARTRDKAVRLYGDSMWTARKIERDLINRASGAIAGMKQRFSSEEQPDEEVLVARVRSTMGHHVSNPHSIEVSCTSDGCVDLSGDIADGELSALLSAVWAVPGVTGVINRLKTGSTPSRGTEQSTHMRVLMGLMGSALAAYGMRRSGAIAKTAGGLGAGLVASSVSNIPIMTLAGTVAHWPKRPQQVH